MPIQLSYSSTNHGALWARTTTQPNSSATCSANDQGSPSYRVNNSYMAVSPGNENTVYLGTSSGGVWYTLNGGTTWTQISTSTIPAGTTPTSGCPSSIPCADVGQGNLIAFDPSDATGNTVYITSYGNGAWKCTAALSSPSCTELNSTGMPTTFKTEIVDQAGTVWIVDNANGGGGALQRYLSGGWSTQLTVSGNPMAGVAVDPGRIKQCLHCRG